MSCFVAIPVIADGNTITVDPTAEETATSFKTIKKALEALTDGDKLIIKAGTYDAKVSKNINFTGLSDEEKKEAVAAVSGAVAGEIVSDSEEV